MVGVYGQVVSISLATIPIIVTSRMEELPGRIMGVRLTTPLSIPFLADWIKHIRINIC